MIRPAAFLLCVAAGAAEANTVGCGGNSYSFAEVVTAPRARVSKDAPPRPPARRGESILVVPHSLCADLIEERGSQYEPSQVDVELPLPGGRRPRR